MDTKSINHIVKALKVRDASGLIKVLQHIQLEYGLIEYNHISEISKLLNIPESKVYGIATYYNQFHFKKKGKYHVQICNGVSCHINDKNYLVEEAERIFGIAYGETSLDNRYSMELVPCMGACALSPVIAVNQHVFTQVDLKKLRKIFNMIENDSLELDED
jgi:NADH-quinone oxidoreductase subunit E